MSDYYNICTGKAPVNIALIKYWGKSDEKLKIPINDSLSGTLSLDHMSATTTVAISNSFSKNELWLNGEQQDISEKSLPGILLNSIKVLSKLDSDIVNKCKVHIVSQNNFPTAAGLASSAAGYACLAYVLGHVFGVTDPEILSKFARQGSGSACRSLFGGFVQWVKGSDHDSSKAIQIVDHEHWPQMRVIICVVNDQEKDISSSSGMRRSVETSALINYRADVIVPDRVEKLKKAILEKDFETFANLTMKDSNQFHAICLDSFPPIFYLNETSRQIIKICSIINAHHGKNVVAYTFDAGPNACVYLLDDFVDTFLGLLKRSFPIDLSGQCNQDSLIVQGYNNDDSRINERNFETLLELLECNGILPSANRIKYLISTSIGTGPKIVQEHLDHKNLKPSMGLATECS